MRRKTDTKENAPPNTLQRGEFIVRVIREDVIFIWCPRNT